MVPPEWIWVFNTFNFKFWITKSGSVRICSLLAVLLLRCCSQKTPNTCVRGLWPKIQDTLISKQVVGSHDRVIMGDFSWLLESVLCLLCYHELLTGATTQGYHLWQRESRLLSWSDVALFPSLYKLSVSIVSSAGLFQSMNQSINHLNLPQILCER